MLAYIAVVLMGGLVPVAAIYATTHGLNIILAAIVVIAGLGSAVALGVVGMGVGFASGDDHDRERLRILRASNRAMIEEMDEMVKLLSEVRDYLVKGGSSSD